MPPTFRYRYVDFGTSFVGNAYERSLDDAAETSGILFANALALDVGGTCWGANEPLPIIDHHFSQDGQFPSASAAVLHKAALIRERFAHEDLVWLVTHSEPDFDAFCSMYLARWIIEDSNALTDWRPYGLHPDGWLDLPTRSRIDWFKPDLAALAPEYRWALLLASYASLLESRRRISCPRQRALRSVLYAAIKRGRHYLSQSSGATELFDEVRLILQQQQLNPAFDSVLEHCATFAPELAMLDGEAAAYERDMLRARRSIVYLPESEAPSPDFFKDPRQMTFHDRRRASDLDAEHLLLADTFRIPTDAIYLRDPECQLFTEWARLDLEHSTLGAGFEFTAIADSNARPDAPANKTGYEFSIDPERARGRHLYTVWSRLQTQEVEALREHQQDVVAMPAGAVHRGSQGAATLGSLLADPWIGGQSKFGNAVSTPHRGTLIAPAGTRSDLRDDPVAEAVRTELEGSIYSAASLVTGPQVAVYDLAGTRLGVDISPQRYELNAPLQIPAPPEGYFRFAALRLRTDVPVPQPNLARQIGETLWQVLYPEMPGAMPPEFAERQLLVTATWVGVWAGRGIAIAYKQPGVGASPDRSETELRSEFASIVSLTRDIDRWTSRWVSLAEPAEAVPSVPATRTIADSDLRTIVTAGEELVTRAARIQQSLTLPEQELFRRFSEAIHLDRLTASLSELTHAAFERIRQRESAEQAKHTESRADAVNRVQRKLGWLEVFALGFVALIIIDLVALRTYLGRLFETGLVLLGGPVFVGLTAWILKPWRRTPNAPEDNSNHHTWILAAIALACLIAWIAGLLQFWNK